MGDPHSKIEDEWLPVEVDVREAKPRTPFQPQSYSEFPDQPVEDGARLAIFENLEAPSSIDRLKFRLQLALETPLDRLRLAWAYERNAGVFFLWQPVFFGLGCLLYFNLPREPLAWAFPVLGLMCATLAWRISSLPWVRAALLLLMLLALGASAAQWRTARVDTGMLSRSVIIDVAGLVTNAEHRADGRVRYTIRVSPATSGVKSRAARDFDGLMRITARKGGPQIGVGEGIAGKVKVDAPSGPAYPGGYSFAFQSWFRGIGASGFFLGKPAKVDLVSESTATIWIAKLRANMSRLIREALPDRNGGLAAALIVGDRSGIDEETAEMLRRSGLAHILAISGLHMALVAATVISGMRLLLAGFPTIVLAYPVRKWAAITALVAATFYLVLSSANVSTQRAYIMVAIMLLAVVLDQRALTMRNVAIAAFVVLVLAPEAILMPGFQMSFAAVAALVATYETLSKRSRERGLNGRMASYGLVRRFLVRDMGGLALTSLVAGIATGLFAAYHFHRIAPLGLVANLGAMPLVSLIVMPLALLSVLAMPFGLEQYPLWLMAWGTEGVVEVAGWVSRRGPGGNTGFIPLSVVVLGTIALLIACLFKTRIRLVALPVLALAVAGMGVRSSPDVLILENGAQVGLLRADGRLKLMRPRAEKFSTKIWKRAYAPEMVAEYASPVAASDKNVDQRKPKISRKASKEPTIFKCDDFGCAAKVRGMSIVSVQQSASLTEDCLLADILIIRFKAPDACNFIAEPNRPITIDQSRLKRFGAHALRISDPDVLTTVAPNKAGQITVTTAFGPNPRPWTRHRHAGY